MPGGMGMPAVTADMRCCDPEMAEDLIAAAFNDAVNKVNAESQQRMSAVTAGMPIPPGMKLPGLF